MVKGWRKERERMLLLGEWECGGRGGLADHKENRPIRERTAGLGRGQMIKASQVMAESGFHLFRWQRGTHWHSQRSSAGERCSDSCIRKVTSSRVKRRLKKSSARGERPPLPASAAQVSEGVASALKQPQWKWGREDGFRRHWKGTTERALSPVG